MRRWQRLLLEGLLAERPNGLLQHRQALIGLARKNAKSTLLSCAALYELVEGHEGGEVYSVAGDQQQAAIVFGVAKRMVELDPTLSEILTPYRYAIENKATGSVYRVVTSKSVTKEGLNPTLVIFDEVHVQPNRDLWDVFSLAFAARPEPLMVGITTAGVMTDMTGAESLCYGLYRYGCQVASGDIDDPRFFFAWWEPNDPKADHQQPETWREANPGLDDIVSVEDFESAVKRTPEPEFRTKRCNQWVASESSWLPSGAWDACKNTERTIPVGADVVLGFDGSFNGDSTALVAVTCGERPFIDVVHCWEAPANDPDWAVPIEEVEEAIRQAAKRYRAREIVCDPYRWARSMQILAGERLRMVEYPQRPERMIPATTRLYESIMNQTVEHSGNPDLARHINNAVLKTDSRGSRLSKESKGSSRHIDLAIAATMAFDRASGKTSRARFISFSDL